MPEYLLKGNRMEDGLILAGNSEERNLIPGGKAGLQNQLGHWPWSGSRWTECPVLSFSILHEVQEPRPWGVATPGSSLFPPWKPPHRYTQMQASLKLYGFLNPIKLKYEINSHRLEKNDESADSLKLKSGSYRQRKKIGLSADLIFSSVLIKLSWYSGTHP